jgi:hypothetical protein
LGFMTQEDWDALPRRHRSRWAWLLEKLLPAKVGDVFAVPLAPEHNTPKERARAMRSIRSISHLRGIRVKTRNRSGCLLVMRGGAWKARKVSKW